MQSELAYRFRTVGCRGNIEVSDGLVHCELWWRRSSYSFQIPLSSVSPYPTRVQRLPRTFFVCLLTAFATGLIGVCALIDHKAFWFNLYGGTILIAVAAVLVAMAYHYRKEEWLIFHTASAERALVFAKNRNDAEGFETFATAIAKLIESKAIN